MFDTQVVLVRVGRLEIRVNDRCPRIEAREGSEGIQEIYVVVERLTKRDGGACRPEWITQECVSRGRCCGYVRFVDANIGGCVGRGLTVELEGALCLQRVIENAPPSADAGRSVVEWLPRKPESRCKVRFIREVHSRRC